MYEKLKEILTLAWKDDDRMDQDTLFELQDKLTGLVLEVAQDDSMVDDLINSFPYLYKFEK
jgi:hypothetical protein